MNSVYGLCQCVCECGGMSHGCQQLYRWPETLPWLVSLSLRSHNLHSWLAGNRRRSHSCHGFLSKSIWRPYWTLSSSLIGQRKWGDWLIDCSMQIVILPSESRLSQKGLVMSCFKDVLYESVFACACCPFRKHFFKMMALGRRRSGWLKLHRRSKMESALRWPFWLLCEHWHLILVRRD